MKAAYSICYQTHAPTWANSAWQGWLLTHADVQEIQERQAAVAELKSRLDFREDLAVSGESRTYRGKT